jgi:aquaporin Z
MFTPDLPPTGYGAHSPVGYSLAAGFVSEIVLTEFFLIVIHGATDSRAPKGFAPIAIGLCLTLIHLVRIPVTTLSVNPARSTGPAIFVGGRPLQQLWMFWIAPLIGGIIGGAIYHNLFGESEKKVAPIPAVPTLSTAGD